MHCIYGTQGVQTLAHFVFVFKFRLRMPSASSPALSRVASIIVAGIISDLFCYCHHFEHLFLLDQIKFNVDIMMLCLLVVNLTCKHFIFIHCSATFTLTWVRKGLGAAYAVVKSKEMVGNSWIVLKVILDQLYHHNH